MRIKATVIRIPMMVAFACTTAHAQCPSGFVNLGEITSSAPAGREVTVRRDLIIPEGIRIDESYLQHVIRVASDGAGSNMSAIQIPPGFHLMPTGSPGVRWAVDQPRLETASDSAQLKFSLELWIKSDRRNTPRQQMGIPADIPDVRVRVCVKPLITK